MIDKSDVGLRLHNCHIKTGVITWSKS